MNHVVLDETLLTSYVNDLNKDIVKQMIELYIQQSEIYFNDINKAVVQQSNALWQEHCHKMKGAAGSVGLKKLHTYLAEVEKSQASSVDKSAIMAQINQLNTSGITAFNLWLNAV
ncbi:MAG: Hpt domain-containing protein [Colwellia sp.]|nr:Hpt domain-containing protein [Colwellia sp.]